MLDAKRIKDLEVFAAEIRLETFKEICSFGMGHIGGAMSMVETLAVLYGEVMNIDPADPKKEDRDYFTLSKGHSGPSLYATLALKGFFPVETLSTLNANGTILPSHCSRAHTPGIDITTGSLGTGISAAVGAALASRIMKAPNYSYCIVGDGEMDEGQVWEAILFAAQQKLDNFVLFIDYNKVQLDGKTADICDLGDVAQKMRDFGFFTQDIDGNDISAVYDAVMAAKAETGRPSAIVLNTVKGQGSKPALDAAAAGKMNHAMLFPNKEENAAEVARLEEVLNTLKAERSAM